jgi:putative ABC transport system permease protein
MWHWLRSTSHWRAREQDPERELRAHGDIKVTWGWTSLEQVRRDLSYAARTFARTPGFTALVVLTLAFGIGSSTVLFSIVNAVLVRPLPYSQPEEIVTLWESDPKQGSAMNLVSPAAFRDWKTRNHVFTQLAAFIHTTFTLTGGDQPERVAGELVSSDFLSVLGAQPALGRGFLPEDEQHVPYTRVLLGHGLWERRFSADPKVVGRTMQVNGRPLTIIGVMPPGFRFPSELIRAAPDIWVPLARPPQEWLIRDFRYLRVVGRLRPGVTFDAAAVEMSALQRSIAMQLRQKDGADVRVVSLQREMTGDVETPLLVLLGAVFCLLLIGCVNVANLLLARGSARQREFAIRMALGAGRERVLRQLCVEGLLLALAGGGLGILFVVLTTRDVIALAPASIPRLGETRVDVTVLGFAFIVSLFVGVLAGLAPAVGISGAETSERLKAGGRGAIGESSANRLRGLLVVGEIALALVLLDGAGLMMQSLYRLGRVDPGFRTDHTLTFFVSLPDANYRDGSRRTAFFRDLLEQIRVLRGVESVGGTTALPLSGSNESYSFNVQGRSRSTGEPMLVADYRTITPDYFQALGIPLRGGRFFNERDTADSSPVVIVNEALARKYFATQNPLGQHIHVGHDHRPGMSEIVGIVGDVKHAGLSAEPVPEMYESYEQMPTSSMTIAVRTFTDPRSLVNGIRSELATLDRNVPPSRVLTIDELVSDTLAPSRFRSVLLGIFAFLAVVLAAVGVYGVMAYSVSRRTREIGIRMALGAGGGSVVWLVMREVMTLAAIGLAIGLPAAWALIRLVETQLFGISATDPVTMLLATVGIGGVAALAGYLPARRATGIDPIRALRWE